MKLSVGKLALAGLVGLMLLAAPSVGSAKAKAPGPCDGDITQFCSAVKGHPKKVHACLKEHKADLSQACKDAHHWK